jgi:hypothetical protein
MILGTSQTELAAETDGIALGNGEAAAMAGELGGVDLRFAKVTEGLA